MRCFVLLTLGIALACGAVAAERPLVAVLAHNDGTETTDFLVPFGVLSASGAAEVVPVALRAGDVALMPALRVQVPLDLAQFDARHPDGADFVIVPALHHWQDEGIRAWLQRQAAAGATLVGICEGAWVLADAGLLDGRNATTHWFSAADLREDVPRMTWVQDRRYVVDGPIVTSTGVSASVPVALMLVERIAGREPAQRLARELGVASWDAAHQSDAYELDRRALWTASSNLLAFWRWDEVRIPVRDGVDEVALALTADAYARTYRTSVRSQSSGAAQVATRHGLVLLPDETAAHADLPEIALAPSGSSALAAALRGIAARYGEPTASFVALQLETPR